MQLLTMAVFSVCTHTNTQVTGVTLPANEHIGFFCLFVCLFVCLLDLFC